MLNHVAAQRHPVPVAVCLSGSLPPLFAPRVIALLVLSALLLAQTAVAAPTLAAIQQQWDTTNFTLTGKAQEDAFEQLQEDCEHYTKANPTDPEGWVWRGIVNSSFAGAKGGLGALGLAKKARKYFDKAIALDGTVMHGSAYTSLGTLYYSVPGWPVGFGDDEKAEAYLQKGVSLNPDGIDSHYFYAQFLAQQGQLAAARKHYAKALSAPGRPGRATADAGRRAQITAALAELDE